MPADAIIEVKQIAKVFYDRLAQAGYRGPPLTSGQIYPWSSATADDAAYATVNIGQLKRVFSFDLDAAKTVAAGPASRL